MPGSERLSVDMMMMTSMLWKTCAYSRGVQLDVCNFLQNGPMTTIYICDLLYKYDNITYAFV